MAFFGGVLSFRRFVRRSGVGFALLGAGLFHAPPAHACGGCFHEPTPPTQNASVVTDHRMAFSVSPARTILWDQIRYQGDPADFAWVLPVGQGAYVELARDEWLGALDSLTAPSIAAPPVSCPGTNAGGGGFGCSSSAAYAAYDGGSDASSGGVQVISQDVVGPYEAVTIRSSSGEAISAWLTGNGYAIPPNIQPILDAYTNEGFDFIALKLAPNQGVQAMQPVRVITPGASASLPLRMVAAGIGSSVGLTLYVVSEGRYEPKNFPSLLIDRTKLLWDPYQVRSNYTQLFDDTVAAGRGWVTEFAGSAAQLSSVYKSACFSRPSVQVPCDTGDAGAADASADDASAADAATDAEVDASSVDSGPCTQTVPACDVFDDYDVATQGMLPYDVQISRLRTTLPASALDVDLEIGAAADQAPLSAFMTATGYTDPSYDPCGAPSSSNKRGDGCDVGADGGATVRTSLGIAALAAFGRRRRSRRDA